MAAVFVVIVGVSFGSRCGETTSDGRALLNKGELAEAERVTTNELTRRPGDLEARMLLGEIYVKRKKPAAAGAIFYAFMAMPKFNGRVARIYADAIPSAEGDAVLFADYALQAARFDEARRPEICQALLVHARHSRKDETWRTFANAASAVNDDCQKKTLETLKSWIADGDTRPDVAALANEIATYRRWR